jgi:hypothetical protein
MTAEGRYLYCVTEGAADEFGKIGLSGKDVFAVPYKDIAAVVSAIPFKTIESTLTSILTHQQVVEASTSRATTLPVRFGVIFKNEEGVKELLSKSYASYRAKIDELRGKEEFGAKVILDEAGLKRIRTEVERESDEVGKLRKSMAKATRGTLYLLRIKLDEALRSETARRIGDVSGAVHSELGRAAVQSTLLKSDHEQIILNGAYLVDRSRHDEFQSEAEKVKNKFEKQGLAIHVSGPWAPYSFC